MKVMVLSNGKLEVRDINNGLGVLQEIVGGYIGIPYMGDKFRDNGIDIIIKEGKLIDGLNPEIAIIDNEAGQVLDIVYGNCIFASHDDEGETISLNDKQMQIVAKSLKTSVMLTSDDKKILARALFV